MLLTAYLVLVVVEKEGQTPMRQPYSVLCSKVNVASFLIVDKIVINSQHVPCGVWDKIFH